MPTYKEFDFVLLKDGRKVVLLDFLGNGDKCIFEDEKKGICFYPLLGNVACTFPSSLWETV